MSFSARKIFRSRREEEKAAVRGDLIGKRRETMPAAWAPELRLRHKKRLCKNQLGGCYPHDPGASSNWKIGKGCGKREGDANGRAHNTSS